MRTTKPITSSTQDNTILRHRAATSHFLRPLIKEASLIKEIEQVVGDVKTRTHSHVLFSRRLPRRPHDFARSTAKLEHFLAIAEPSYSWSALLTLMLKGDMDDELDVEVEQVKEHARAEEGPGTGPPQPQAHCFGQVRSRIGKVLGGIFIQNTITNMDKNSRLALLRGLMEQLTWRRDGSPNPPAT